MSEQYKKQRQQIVDIISENITEIELLDGGGDFDLRFLFRSMSFVLTTQGELRTVSMLTTQGELGTVSKGFPFMNIAVCERSLFDDIDQHFHGEARTKRRAVEEAHLEAFLNGTL